MFECTKFNDVIRSRKSMKDRQCNKGKEESRTMIYKTLHKKLENGQYVPLKAMISIAHAGRVF